MEHVYIHNTELLWGTKVHAKYKPTYYLQCHSINKSMSSSDREASYSHSYNRKGFGVIGHKKKILLRYNATRPWKEKELFARWISIIFDFMQNFVWSWLKFWCSHSAIFFFIKLHAYQFTFYFSFEKKWLQKHTVSGMLHVNSLAVLELKVIKFWGVGVIKYLCLVKLYEHSTPWRKKTKTKMDTFLPLI